MFSQPYKLIQIQKSWYLVEQNFQISGSGSTCRAVKTKFHSQLVKFWVTFAKYVLMCHQYLKGFILWFQRKAICYNWRTDVSSSSSYTKNYQVSSISYTYWPFIPKHRALFTAAQRLVLGYCDLGFFLARRRRLLNLLVVTV